jgi:chromate transporter
MLIAFIGLTAFGGPAAHVALMRRMLVERRRWVEPAEFNRMFAACNLIPGPSSTELAMFLGYRLAGWTGLLLAAVCFIAPAMLIMLALSVLYSRYAGSVLARDLLYGVRPVVVAIVAWAVLDLARKLLDQRRLLALVPVSIVLYVLGLNPVLILVVSGLIGAVLSRWPKQVPSILAGVLVLPHPERLTTLLLVFLKIGAISFGSGYVLYAFLHSDFVAGLHWLSGTQLADAVALGQVTPGPVFTTATFLGYLFAGVPGALIATIAIFLPGLVLVPLLDRLVGLVESRQALGSFLGAVNAAVIGLVVAVSVELGRVAFVDAVSVVLALFCFPIVLWRPLSTPALVAFGAAVGATRLIGW